MKELCINEEHILRQSLLAYFDADSSHAFQALQLYQELLLVGASTQQRNQVVHRDFAAKEVAKGAKTREQQSFN